MSTCYNNKRIKYEFQRVREWRKGLAYTFGFHFQCFTYIPIRVHNKWKGYKDDRLFMKRQPNSGKYEDFSLPDLLLNHW